MRIDHLKSFEAAKQYSNFSEAAFSLYVSQSTLSKHIKSLEEDLGVSLFERKHSSVTITPAGKQIALYTNKILELYEEMLSVAHNYSGVSHKKLRIVSMYDMTQYGIVDAIVQYEKNIENFHVESLECEHNDMIKQLANDNTDMVIGYKELLHNTNEYICVPLRKDCLVLVVNAKHPIGQNNIINLSDVDNIKFCFPQEDFALFNYFCDSCIASGISPNLTRSNVRLSTIKQYILAEMRGTLQISERAKRFFKEPDFSIVSLKDIEPLTLSILYNENKKNKFVDDFTNHAVSFFSN